MNQSLSSYYIFYEVAQAGSFSKAAAQLYISQPAISRSIQKLEDSMGTRLFLRTPKGVRLTPEGTILYHHLETAFSSIESAEQKIETLTNSEGGTLHIGVSTTLCKHLLLPYLSAFIRQYPAINIRIRCQSSNETLQMLTDDTIDIGLVGMPEQKSNLCYDHLLEIEDIFVATASYMKHLPPKAVTTREILESSTLMLLDKKNMTRQYIDDYLTQNQIRTKDYIEISDMDLLIEFAKISVGVACVIKNFVTEELKKRELIQIPLDLPIHKRNVGFAYKKTQLQNKALNTFLQFCRQENFSPIPQIPETPLS